MRVLEGKGTSEREVIREELEEEVRGRKER